MRPIGTDRPSLPDHFHVTGLVREGPVTTVWAAEDLAACRPVAVTLLAPSLAGDRRAREPFAEASRA